MITDRIQLAGPDSYFQDPDPTNATPINLGGIAPTIRTAPLNKGKQLEISGIQLLIDHDNLRTLMKFQSPLFKISVMKEMFAGLFADPYSHRVHNIAGFLDFNEGTLTNGKVMEIDGVPTIVSSTKDECVWVSKEYEMPDPISINAIAWELATSKLTPPDSFHYKINIASTTEDAAGNITALPDIDISNGVQMLKANAKRAVDKDNDQTILDGLNNQNIKRFKITFTAKVFEDSYLNERHLPSINENIGRPLLRAINILEPVQSIYEIHSIVELQNLCSDFHLFENPGPAIKRLTATLDLNATLVNSVNQFIHPDNISTNPAYDIYDTASVYEFIELEILSDKFTRFEAKIVGFDLRRNNS